LALDKYGAREAGGEARLPASEGRDSVFAGWKSAGFDAEVLWRRVDGDRELLHELIAVFEKEEPELLERMQAAIGARDAVGLERAAHKMKGALLQFSAGTAAATALKLEETGRAGTLSGAEETLAALRRQVGWLLESLRALARVMGANA
jgi:HPt (histidine-containing phosphotransfer) domain-containing protein